ncbi:MAG: AbrB/MazE/SpoVT family DNA-binding domain-containing protein [bacterium]|nr:AbrB/MazE/SpoVT family DNA-binding domain-containing protein [bacterium]
MTYLVTVSPKGQITIPVAERRKLRFKKYLLQVKGSTLTLKPAEVKIAKESKDDLRDFNLLSLSSMDFWNNKEDDVYQEFYSKPVNQLS